MIKKLIQEKIERIGPGPTPLKEVVLTKITEPMSKIDEVLTPAICLIAQGEKIVYLGNKKYRYDENKFLLGTVNVPIHVEVKKASIKSPYYGLGIYLNPVIISELLLELDQYHTDNCFIKAEGLITTSKLTDDILNPIIKLLKIIDDPVDVKILGKQFLREIYYQILKSDAGPYLKNCAFQHSCSHQIVPIIHYMENHLHENISIDDLTKRAGISPSSLLENFKKATSLPPMQYLKKLRLNHANELLLNGSNVSEAAINSGYNSTTQFSREFKRQYGISPSKVGQAA